MYIFCDQKLTLAFLLVLSSSTPLRAALRIEQTMPSKAWTTELGVNEIRSTVLPEIVPYLTGLRLPDASGSTDTPIGRFSWLIGLLSFPCGLVF